jgi:hypothetical protein
MPRPFYWKPKYTTRSMRHRAWLQAPTAKPSARGR